MYDERSGTHYSKILHEKGFDNVYLLSGGLEKFYETSTELVEGSELPALPKTATKKVSKTASTMNKTGTSMKTAATKK
jgi:hypothetical protein